MQAVAIPQAIGRLLATPRMLPRLPCISPLFSTIPILVRPGGPPLFGIPRPCGQDVNGTGHWGLQVCRFCRINAADTRNSFSLRVLCYEEPASGPTMIDFRQDVEAMIPALRRYA